MNFGSGSEYGWMIGWFVKMLISLEWITKLDLALAFSLKCLNKKSEFILIDEIGFVEYLLSSKLDGFERRAGYRSIKINRYDQEMLRDMESYLVNEEGKFVTLYWTYDIESFEYEKDSYISRSKMKETNYVFILNKNSPYNQRITKTVTYLHQVIKLNLKQYILGTNEHLSLIRTYYIY